jgi:hypothetical protein
MFTGLGFRDGCIPHTRKWPFLFFGGEPRGEAIQGIVSTVNLKFIVFVNRGQFPPCIIFYTRDRVNFSLIKKS